MMSLYELIENAFALLETIANTGAMTSDEEDTLDELESVWYNYYEKILKGES